MLVDKTGHSPEWGFIGTAIGIAVLTAVFVVAVIASAGAVGVLAGGVAASIGATGAISTAITAGTVGTYVVAGGVGAFGANRAYEALSGDNIIADSVFQGNYQAYETTEAAFNMAGYGAVSAAQSMDMKQKGRQRYSLTYLLQIRNFSMNIDMRAILV